MRRSEGSSPFLRHHFQRLELGQQVLGRTDQSHRFTSVIWHDGTQFRNDLIGVAPQGLTKEKRPHRGALADLRLRAPEALARGSRGPLARARAEDETTPPLAG